MLEYIRDKSQSLGVKLAFALIILVFVFWGVGNFNDRSSGTLVAVVNGDAITMREFELAYRNAEENLLRGNPGLTREQLKQQQLGRQVLRDLVTQTLLSQEAARTGVTVTPVELRVAIGNIKSFQNEKGQFDPAVYARVLAAQRLTPAQFEQDTAREMLRQKIYAMVTAPAWADPAEAQKRFEFLREKRDVDYIFINEADFASSIKPADADVAAYYESHKAQFAVPAKADVSYVLVNPQDLVKASSISSADAQKWYEENAARFEQKEEVKAAHILVPLAEDAPEADVKKAQEQAAKIEAELKSGKSFAAVADEHNGPNAAGPGGELGWVKRGMTVKPFEDAAFALDAGKVSAPVRSQFGLHIIKVEEKKTGGLPPFKQVEAEVLATMAQEQGVDKLHDVVDSLVEDNILGRPLKQGAEKYGLKWGETGLLTAADLIKTLGVTAEGAAVLVGTPAGNPVDTALEAGKSYVVARVLKSEPATTAPLDSVKGQIVKTLIEEKALVAALDAASQLRKELDTAPLGAAGLKGREIKIAKGVERNGGLPGFAPNPEMTEALFEAKAGQWLPVAYAVEGENGSGAVLVRVKGIQPPDAAEWDMVKDIMGSAVTRDRANALFEMFMQRLVSSAKIKVYKEDFVDRKNM
ncbi:MAG: peptidylprolyl isomerase [Desulfovibrio sp. MES5]|uniref:SurA N-terminal domain-containing protein n=1 Tax=Desulfovibrio sp. MES5 TaxID=1899016 RepID=UPI000B9CD983|nr:SurA N-terminal domain-containing protein [Desulfovibrio sp. MES5]OXS28043.1 MAG: peptidylprolyl isomerase [Desulfovibrio sp. MES5]